MANLSLTAFCKGLSKKSPLKKATAALLLFSLSMVLLLTSGTNIFTVRARSVTDKPYRDPATIKAVPPQPPPHSSSNNKNRHHNSSSNNKNRHHNISSNNKNRHHNSSSNNKNRHHNSSSNNKNRHHNSSSNNKNRHHNSSSNNKTATTTAAATRTGTTTGSSNKNRHHNSSSNKNRHTTAAATTRPAPQQQQQQEKAPPSSPQTDNIPESLKGVINSTEELKGRHSDYLMPPCQDPDGLYQWKTYKRYDFVEPLPYLKNYKNPCWLDGQNQLKCVPHIYLIGTPKAGSSDFFNRITHHPQLLEGKEKEIRWFDRRRFYPKEKRYKYFKDYVKFYSRATQNVQSSVVTGTNYHNKVIADGGPTYYFSSYNWKFMPGNEGCSEPRVTAISHIHHLWPDAKLMLLARNPTTRLYSAYNFNAPVTGAKRTPQEFHEWVLQSMDVWKSCLSNHSLRYCMYDGHIESYSKVWSLHIGLYSRYILDVLKVFPREQLLIIPTEEYSVNTVEWLRKIFKFLDLDELSDEQLKAISKLPRVNKTKGKKPKPMLDKTKILLEDFYRPYNQELADILGVKDFIWLKS